MCKHGTFSWQTAGVFNLVYILAAFWQNIVITQWMSHDFDIQGGGVRGRTAKYWVEQGIERTSVTQLLLFMYLSDNLVCMQMCACACVWVLLCKRSSGSMFECHWNLISQRHSEKEKRSLRKSWLSLQLAWTIQPLYWLSCSMCPDIQTSICVCEMFWSSSALGSVMLSEIFFFFTLLDVFFLDFHAWSGSRTNAQSCEEPTRVNCPSQNTKPIICKTAEFCREREG